jgi:hypothetical protein
MTIILIDYVVDNPWTTRNFHNMHLCVATGTEKCENPDPNCVSAIKFPCSGNLT